MFQLFLNLTTGSAVSARAMKLCIEEIEADPSSSNAHFLTCPGRSGASGKGKSWVVQPEVSI